MKQFVIVAMTAVSVAVASGCFVPGPGSYQRIPEMHGVVLDSGTPARNVSVWSSESHQCEDQPSIVAITGDDGSFHLPGLRRFRFGVVVTGGDPGFSWSLCIRPAGNRSALRWTKLVLGWQVPESMELRCDLTDVDVCR